MSSELTRSLEGRIALVTGGAVRVGRATVLELARRGAQVAFTWHGSEAAAKSLEAELDAQDASFLSIRCDLTDEEQVDAAFARLDEELGGLDLLVNNAAIFEETPFEEIDTAAWRRHIDLNLTGSFLCAHRAGQRMTAGDRDDGLIVNIGCAGGLRPWPRHLAYSVSKAGLLMLTQCLARSLAPRVRCNAVLPGPVLFPDDYDERQRKEAVARTTLKREGRPEDVVRAILFCWESDYTTGALIPVEGGRLLL